MKRAIAWSAALAIAAACGGASEGIRPLDDGRYTLRKYFVGLDEEVLLVKDPSRVYAIRADGSELPYLALMDHEATAYRQRFGNADLFLARRLDTMDPNDLVTVAVEFEVDWTSLAPR